MSLLLFVTDISLGAFKPLIALRALKHHCFLVLRIQMVRFHPMHFFCHRSKIVDVVVGFIAIAVIYFNLFRNLKTFFYGKEISGIGDG
jgi:hypothetical protein